MGKRLQGAALRAKKRQKALTDELQEQQAEQVAQQPVVDQSNQELFVLDTKGENVPKHQRPTNNPKAKKSKETVWSDQERKEIEKLVKLHSKEELASMVKDGQRLFDKSNHLRTHGIRKARTPCTTFDLWGEPGDKPLAHGGEQNQIASDQNGARKDDKNLEKSLGGQITKKAELLRPKGRSKQVAVDVAKGGQSYRPDPREHHTILRVALTVEERRHMAEIEKNAPISPGMSEATKALLLADSDTSDDDDSEDEDSNNKDNNKNEAEKANETSDSVFHKQKDKLTRAQRNKQKRLRQEELMRLNAKRSRLSEHQVFQIARLRKEVTQEEKLRRQRQEEKRKRQEEKASQTVGTHIEQELSQKDPIAAPSFPVALPSEVIQKESSLRTMIPKGSLVTDRMASYALRSLAAKLPSLAAAQREAAMTKKQRSKKKVKGAKEWQGENFVIIK